MAAPDPGEANWNVVASLPGDTFREARRLLGRWGTVRGTHFYNVFAMRVVDPNTFLNGFAAAVAELHSLLNTVSHVVPAQHTFDFRTREESEVKAREILLAWRSRLAGTSFHVRLHWRRQREVLPTHLEEQILGETLLDALIVAGTPGRISFDDPDKFIQIKTIDGRAGVSLWSREDRRRCPFLGGD